MKQKQKYKRLIKVQAFLKIKDEFMTSIGEKI